MLCSIGVQVVGTCLHDDALGPAELAQGCSLQKGRQLHLVDRRHDARGAQQLLNVRFAKVGHSDAAHKTLLHTPHIEQGTNISSYKEISA